MSCELRGCVAAHAWYCCRESIAITIIIIITITTAIIIVVIVAVNF